MASFEKAILNTFKAEGGFQNHVDDSANYCNGNLIGTNRGISAIGYKSAYGVCPTVAQMKALTVDQAKYIYKRNYWDKLNLDKVKNQSVAELMFQYIIGSGASQISDIKAQANDSAKAKILVEDDSVITDDEINKINKVNQKTFFTELWNWRYEFYHRLVALKPDKAVFLQGWINRLNTHKFLPTQIDVKKF